MTGQENMKAALREVEDFLNTSICDCGSPFCKGFAALKRPARLPPNVIEISAVCGDIRVMMVDEIGPGYLIRLTQVPWPPIWRIIPDGYFCCRGNRDGLVHEVVLGFHPGADLSKLRIRLLVDGVPYEVNGAAPEDMQRVKELPASSKLIQPPATNI